VKTLLSLDGTGLGLQRGMMNPIVARASRNTPLDHAAGVFRFDGDVWTIIVDGAMS
jgi:hypothetical protein